MNSKRQGIIQAVVAVGIVIALQMVSQYVYTRWDLTEDNRFTVTEGTVRVLEQMDKPILAEILLPTDLPKEFSQLREEATDLLTRYRDLTGGLLQYETLDPAEVDADNLASMQKLLAEQGMSPVNIGVRSADQSSERWIYPYIRLTAGSRYKVVPLLERQVIDRSPEEQLNQSLAMMEFKLTQKISRLIDHQRPTVALLGGHGEPGRPLTTDLMNRLFDDYLIGTLYLDSVYKIDQKIACVIVQKPLQPFSERDKFILDQYVMNGGKLIWLVDRLNVSIDSLRTNPVYVPFDLPLNLEDFFFKHGVRINTDAVQDKDCTPIPLASGQRGQERFERYPWPYHIKAMPDEDHVITRGLGRVELKFPSTIDTLKTKYRLKKSILLTSSANARYQFSPMQLSIDEARRVIPDERMNKSFLPVGVLLEGEFASLFENRVSESMQRGLESLGEVYRDKSDDNKMIIVSDGDFVHSLPRSSDGGHWPVGFNIYEGRQYANMDFLLNAIEYLIGDADVIAARKKRITLRPLDKVRARQERSYWQLFNVGLPIVFLALSGLVVTWWRRHRYGRR